MGKKTSVIKPLVWLIIGVVLILTPMLYELMTFFPFMDSTMNFWVIVMHMLFASAFLLLFARSNKFKLDINIYLVAFLFAFFVPLLFAAVVIMPLVTNAMILIYLLMHFVFAGGFLTLYSQQSQIKKLL